MAHPSTRTINLSIRMTYIILANVCLNPGLSRNMILTRRLVLTRYMPRRKVRKVKSLLAGGQEEETEEEVIEEEVGIYSIRRSTMLY